MALEPWGETMPLLKIAAAYRAPYEIPLAVADYYQHKRPISDYVRGLINQMQTNEYNMLCQDVRYISAFVMKQRATVGPKW